MSADERMLRLIGLGRRGGGLAVGVEGTRAAIRRGKARVVVLARDASPRARVKVVNLAKGSKVPVVVGPAADTIGHRLGRPPVHAVAVTDPGLSHGIMEHDVLLVEDGGVSW